MSEFLKDKFNIDLSQPSTQKGLALVGAGAALAFGHPDLLTASVTDTGIQYGGIVGTVVPVLIGLFETVRDEFK
ncbi:hypothetical protein VA7868_04618 [Vibrio aerogenes CECT 7868]|uniref:Uncharacterized protein n=1 Tax=Vibrio aerogenes CECT 7868 TaxID=1216006 RepID=A0A1M6FBG7_9VIBR|nr:hypothetical protein [Vibrio aerogenes]SHI95022.1 hypothetical protein VA7868_04618 [Vibrio aerogenes CECT 7868]